MNRNSTYEYLLSHGVKPSVQRLAVMEYLLTHDNHPAADVIYDELIEKIPTLSKTTVYNTLKLLVEHQAAKMLRIDENKVCFDGHLYPHAHFMCTNCNTVFDLPTTNERMRNGAEIKEGFKIEEVELSYRGLCPDCQKTQL